jgi:hypothetical protein
VISTYLSPDPVPASIAMDRGPKDHFTSRHYAAKDSRGPVPFFNPTRRHIPLLLSGVKSSPAADGQAAGDAPGKTTTESAYNVWRSRDNRKGRHAIAVTPEYAGKSALRPSSSLVETLKGIGKMFVRFPIWDVSYDVALIYTIGMYGTCSVNRRICRSNACSQPSHNSPPLQN